MTNKKVTASSILDQHLSNSVTPSGSDLTDTLPQINFVQDLEFFGAAKYVDSVPDPLATTVLRLAPVGTSISGQDKWKNDNDNFQCVDAALYSFTGNPRSCSPVDHSHFVFVSPPVRTSDNTYVDISTVAISSQSSKEVTIKFFVKFLGFTYLAQGEQTTYQGIPADEVDFFRYGTNMRITLKQVSTTRIDLYLRNSSNQLVGKFENFEARIGKWTHISLSYLSYWDPADTTIYDYYPDMLNFQVGNNQIVITPGTYDKLIITNFLTLTVAKEAIALWTRGMVSYNYFTGFMGIYSSKDNTSLTYANLKKNSTADKLDIFKGSSTTDCLDTTNYFASAAVSALTYNCVRDFDFQIKEEVLNYNCGYAALGETACLTANTNCLLGYIESTNDICSCSNRDKKLMLLNKNDGKNKCQSNYI